MSILFPIFAGDMAEQKKWQWQEPGTAWKGVGLYHITLTIPDRQPLLGTLDIPDGDARRLVILWLIAYWTSPTTIQRCKCFTSA